MGPPHTPTSSEFEAHLLGTIRKSEVPTPGRRRRKTPRHWRVPEEVQAQALASTAAATSHSLRPLAPVPSIPAPAARDLKSRRRSSGDSAPRIAKTPLLD